MYSHFSISPKNRFAFNMIFFFFLEHTAHFQKLEIVVILGEKSLYTFMRIKCRCVTTYAQMCMCLHLFIASTTNLLASKLFNVQVLGNEWVVYYILYISVFSKLKMSWIIGCELSIVFVYLSQSRDCTAAQLLIHWSILAFDVLKVE